MGKFNRRIKRIKNGGKVYKKRNESSLITACLWYLEHLMTDGQIKYCTRLNSGTFATWSRRKDGSMSVRRIRGCREGTPDIMVILNNGSVFWIECKMLNHHLSEVQEEFRKMIMPHPEKHNYLVATDVYEVEQFFNRRR